MDDEALLASLGASAVVASDFEQKFVTRLEEQLKEAEGVEGEGKELLEDGEIEDDDEEDSKSEEEEKEKKEGSEDSVEPVRDEEEGGKDGGFQMEPSNFLLSALTAPNKTPKLPQPAAPTLRTPTAVKKKTPVQKKTEAARIKEKEEIERQRKIRSGEMTPFGTGISHDGSASVGSDRSFLNLDKYLKKQMELQKGRRKLVSQDDSKRKDNRFKESDEEDGGGKKKKGKHHRIITNADESDEDNDDQDDKAKEKVKTKKLKSSGNEKASKSSKSALDYNILFPKKRKRKEKVGSRVSDDPWDARRTPGKTAAERNSMYINASDDSDYVPSDVHSSDDEVKPSTSRAKTTRPKNKRAKSMVEKSGDDDSDWLSSDSDYERPQKQKRARKEADDGNHQYYLNRVQAWKERETRLTGSMHSFGDGFKMPTHLWEQLYDYQKVGVKWLWELHQQRVGGILGDEMGLGKTIQVIAFLAAVSCSNMLFRFSNYRGLGPSIIVCPATVMHQWVEEFHKWWPPFRVGILHESGSYSGSKKSLIKSIQDSNGILITSYVGIVSNQDEILRFQWHYVILDEGHKIRNPDAQATLTVKQVATPHRLILSGSPLQNNLKELWSLFDFIFPARLGTLPSFMEQFAVPITIGGYSNASEIQVATAFKCATMLREIINPYLLRRMKQDVKTHINLPEKNEQVLFCKMTNEQKALYINYINSKEIESIVQGRFNLFVGLINLRKICNHPHLYDGGPKLIKSTEFARKTPKSRSGLVEKDISLEEEEGSDIELDPEDTFGHWNKSGKMIVVETLLRLWHKQKHKVLLFTQSRQMLCILENFVKQQNYTYLRLDGATSIGSRQPLIKRFNEDPDLFVFILTTRVGGLGVNLTGANRILIYDPDWNPSTDSQARERAWRIGQTRNVTIYRLITSGSIEEKMYHRQIFKNFLTNRVLKDARQKRFFKSNDLLELFSFNEGSGKGTESEAIFAGTGSKIKVSKKASKRSKKDRETETDERSSLTPREKSSGKFRDVPYLVKQSKNEVVAAEGQEENDNKRSAKQDEYVLQKLFSKSGVEAALRHDKIVDTDEADYMLVEQEAERVAKEAAIALKKSREQCWSAESGHVNWTGSHGAVRKETQLSKPKFGAKRTTAPATVTSSSLSFARDAASESSTKKLFAGPKLNEPSKDELMKPMTSGDLLAIIRARNRPLSDPSEAEASAAAGSSTSTSSNIKTEHEELFRDIRDYIAFQGNTGDGQATTGEIVDRFKDRLPPESTPLFKKMLAQLCTFRKVDQKGIWRLKPEFR